MDCIASIAGESQRLLVVSRPTAKLGEVPAHMRHRRPQSRRFDRQSLDLVQEQGQEPAATDESSKGQGNNVDHGKGTGGIVVCFMHFLVLSVLGSSWWRASPPSSVSPLVNESDSFATPLPRFHFQEIMTSNRGLYYFHGSVR